MARERPIKGLYKGPLVLPGAVAFDCGQHLAQFVPAPYGIEVLVHGSQHKVLPAVLHRSYLRPGVGAGVVPTDSSHGARAPRGVLYLPTSYKKEVSHDSNAVVAPPHGHRRQLAPVSDPRNVNVLLVYRIEVPQFLHFADFSFFPTNNVKSVRLEARLCPCSLPNWLCIDALVVSQGLINERCRSLTGLHQRMSKSYSMQCIHIHKAKADVLEKLIQILVAAVVFQPPHSQLKVGGRKGKTRHMLSACNSAKIWSLEICLHSKSRYILASVVQSMHLKSSCESLLVHIKRYSVYTNALYCTSSPKKFPQHYQLLCNTLIVQCVSVAGDHAIPESSCWKNNINRGVMGSLDTTGTLERRLMSEDYKEKPFLPCIFHPLYDKIFKKYNTLHTESFNIFFPSSFILIIKWRKVLGD